MVPGFFRSFQKTDTTNQRRGSRGCGGRVSNAEAERGRRRKEPRERLERRVPGQGQQDNNRKAPVPGFIPHHTPHSGQGPAHSSIYPAPPQGPGSSPFLHIPRPPRRGQGPVHSSINPAPHRGQPIPPYTPPPTTQAPPFCETNHLHLHLELQKGGGGLVAGGIPGKMWAGPEAGL